MRCERGSVTTAGFEDGRQLLAKDYGLPLAARTGKETDSPGASREKQSLANTLIEPTETCVRVTACRIVK